MLNHVMPNESGRGVNSTRTILDANFAVAAASHLPNAKTLLAKGSQIIWRPAKLAQMKSSIEVDRILRQAPQLAREKIRDWTSAKRLVFGKPSDVEQRGLAWTVFIGREIRIMCHVMA
jgi:hypothetical protein